MVQVRKYFRYSLSSTPLARPCEPLRNSLCHLLIFLERPLLIRLISFKIELN